MITPPPTIDGAIVLKVADLSHAIPTGRTSHVVTGRPVRNFDALAIAEYEFEEDFYLFYCDETWKVITDTRHATVEDAIAQAEFEYESVAFQDLIP